MSRYPKADLSGIRLRSIAERGSKVHARMWAHPLPPDPTFDAFVDALPDVLAASALRELVDAIVTARRNAAPVIAMIGAHVVKVGLVPLLCTLLEEGVLTGIAMNSAAAIHDTESYLFGQTSEDVAAELKSGDFGMARETGEFINGVLTRGFESGDLELGYGEALGEALASRESEHRSILATAWQCGVPASVHAAIGTDIIHQQPTMRGDATGEMSFRDFRLLCAEVQGLEGGVVLNIGSAVILPEVFLKALTVARNLGAKVFRFTTANFDMIQHYRPRVNVLERPTQDGGRFHSFTGHHEIMVPLLVAMVRQKIRTEARG